MAGFHDLVVSFLKLQAIMEAFDGAKGLVLTGGNDHDVFIYDTNTKSPPD